MQDLAGISFLFKISPWIGTDSMDWSLFSDLKWTPESWNIDLGWLVLGTPIPYPKGMKTIMVQLSGFYYILSSRAFVSFYTRRLWSILIIARVLRLYSAILESKGPCPVPTSSTHVGFRLVLFEVSRNPESICQVGQGSFFERIPNKGVWQWMVLGPHRAMSVSFGGQPCSGEGP